MNTLSPAFGQRPAALRWRVYGATALFAILYTMVSIQWSFHHGKLSYEPTYDDVGYFNDALERTLVFFSDGPLASLKTWWIDPPHSPFSTGLGMVSISLLGTAPVGFYMLNGLVVFALFGLVSRASGWTSVPALFMLLLAVGVVRVSFMAVTEFRPDIAVGIATAAAAACVARGFCAFLEGKNTRRSFVEAGIAMGAGLLIKPTFFLHTLLIPGVALAGGALLSWLKNRDFRKTACFSLKAFGWYMGVGLLIAAPYYAVTYQRVWEYFTRHSSGADAHIWKLPGSFWDVLKHYTLGAGGQPIIIVFTFIAVLGSALFLWRKLYPQFVFCGIVVSCGIISLSVITYGRMGNPYFPATYLVLLIVAGVYALARAPWPGSPPAIVLGLALMALCLAGTALHAPLKMNLGTDESIRGRWNGRIARAIREDWGQVLAVGNPVPVFVAFTGTVNESTMHWESLQEGTGLRFYGGSETWEAPNNQELSRRMLREAKSAAYVVIAEEDCEALATSYPTNRARQLTNQVVTRNFKEVPMPGANSASTQPFRVFRNDVQATVYGRGKTVQILRPNRGFDGVEGPFPKSHLPQVRWGTFPKSEIDLGHDEGKALRLVLEVRGKPGVELVLLVNGTEAVRHAFTNYRFEIIEWSSPSLPPPGKINLEYYREGEKPSSGDRMVLYRNIELNLSSPTHGL